MNLSGKVMRVRYPLACAVLTALSLACACAGGGSGGGCVRGRSWWDRERGACAPCTRCDAARRLVVLYPCQLHRDTICHSLYNVRIRPFNTPTYEYKNSSELPAIPSDEQYYDEDYDSEEEIDESESWDLQTSSLVLALSGCVVFFLVVLVLTLYHRRQWRILKQALQSDVQDLTAKLKLMEAGSDTPSEPVVATDHHIYCNIHAGKEAFLGRNSNKKGLGNVYTQEKHPS